jgi:hypothetical protein
LGLNHSPKIATNGLVLCLDGANFKSYPGSGTSWIDLAGKNVAGTLTNGPTFDSARNGNIFFDGTNDFVSIPDSAVVDISTAITLEAWIFAVKSTGYQNVICKSSNAQNTGYIYPRTDDGWTNTVFYLHVGTWSTLSAPWPSRNAWHHTAATYNGSSMRLFINGKLVNSKNQTGTITVNNNVLAIGNQTSFSEYFGGNISNLRMYNRALSDAEIENNFNALRGRFGI